MVMATFSGVPSFTKLRTAVRRKSCRSIPGQPAFLQAVRQARRKSWIRSPGPVAPEPSLGIKRPVRRVREREGDDAAKHALQSPDALELVGEARGQVGRQIHDAAVGIFRRAGINPDRAGVEVNVAALQRESLVPDAPTVLWAMSTTSWRSGRRRRRTAANWSGSKKPARGAASLRSVMVGGWSTFRWRAARRSMVPRMDSSRLIVALATGPPRRLVVACRAATYRVIVASSRSTARRPRKVASRGRRRVSTSFWPLSRGLVVQPEVGR